MTTAKAFEFALNTSDVFRAFDTLIQKLDEQDIVYPTKLEFSIDGECFYYGIDCDGIYRGKYTSEYSNQLINRNEVLLIR